MHIIMYEFNMQIIKHQWCCVIHLRSGSHAHACIQTMAVVDNQYNEMYVGAVNIKYIGGR